MYEFKMPALGSEMTHGTVLEWRVKVGDKVKRHEIIAEIDTDKAAIEVESFGEGVVEKILVNPGERVPVGTVLAHLRESGVPREPIPAPKEAPTRVRISPRARKLAHDLGIDLSKIKGSGPSGAIIEEDLKKHAGETKEVTVDHAASMQRAIAAAMARSKREIPHYYLSCEIDLSNAMTWLEKYNSTHPMTERLLPAVLHLKAVVNAIKKYPEFNGFYVNDSFQASEAIHVGFAISLRGGGLIAPAILDANAMELTTMMKGLTDLVSRARSGKLRGREVSEPTITITSLGEFGVDSVFGIIYPPQVALVGFGTISSDNHMIATLSADHRVSNGLTGSRFLAEIKKFLEEPELLL